MPHNQDYNIFYNEIVLLNCDYDHPSKFLSLFDQSRNATVQYSGASKTVCESLGLTPSKTVLTMMKTVSLGSLTATVNINLVKVLNLQP